jgi:hypothetical protein
MKKRKKRNAITMVSLLLILVVLIGVYVWYSNKKAATNTSKDTKSISLATVDTSKVTALHYIGKDADVTLVLEDGIWSSKDEPGRPINQEKVSSMLEAIKEIKATKKVVDTPDNLADFGLDKPSDTLEATMEDGSTVTLKLGSEVVSGDGYYALVNNNKAVYMVATSYETSLGIRNVDLTSITEAPSITAENITYLNIDSRDGKDIELKNNAVANLDNSGSNMNSWQILQPYNGIFSAEADKITALQANYTTFDFGHCEDYKGDDLKKYGLDNPAYTIDIGYFETYTQNKPSTTPQPTGSAPANDTSKKEDTVKVDKNYKIFIGNKDKDQDYYVRVDGSNAVYTLSTDTVDKMLQVDVSSLMSHYIAIPNIASVDQINATIGGKQYTMKIDHIAKADSGKATTGKSSDDKADATYYYNDKVASEDSFKELYQKMISAQFDAQLDQKIDISKLEPVMTLSYHLFGNDERTIMASYFPYNDNFYVVDTGIGMYFLVDKRVIDDISNSIATFKPAESNGNAK